MLISTRLKMAALVPALMALVIGVALFIDYSSIEASEQKQATAYRISDSLGEQNDLARSYVLHHEQRPRHQFLLKHHEATTLIATATFEDPQQQEILKRISESNEVVETLFLKLISNYEDHEQHVAAKKDNALLREADERLVGQLLIRSRGAKAEASRLVGLIADDIDAVQRRVYVFTVACLVAAALFLTIVLLGLVKKINRSMGKLREGTEIIGSGNLAHRIGIRSKDEIGRLSRAFDDMTENLQATTVSRDELAVEIEERKRAEEALQGALEDLDIRAEELTTMNEELQTSNEEIEAINEELRSSNDELQHEIQNRIEAEKALAEVRAEAERQKEEIYQREHRIAYVLQKALVPDAIFDIPGCEVAVRYEAALKEAEVGGDFYDVFDIGNNKIGILIGDVAGKGLAAAIQVAAARHSVRSYAYIDPRPAKVMTLANNALSKNSESGVKMLTAFFAVLDLELGAITYANGGHETPVVRRSDGALEELDIGGRALGVMGGYEYQDQRMMLRPGDLVTMVTDGIIEARVTSDNMFGLDGMKSFLAEKWQWSADDLAHGLLAAAKDHSGGDLRDDAAILVFGLRKQ